MKKFIYCVALLALTLGLSCCSKMEDVFNGNDKNAIAPVATTYSEENADVDLLGGLPWYFLQDILDQAGVMNHDHIGALDFVAHTTAAIVINDNSIIKDVLAEYEGKIEINVPEIDFDKYSLVVGSCYLVSGTYYLANQRIKNTSSGVKLYLEVCERKDVAGIHAVFNYYFASLYPKLPSGEVEVVRWDNI